MGMAGGIVGTDKDRTQIAPHQPLKRLPVGLHAPGPAPQFTGVHHAQFASMGQPVDNRLRLLDIRQQIAQQLHAAALGLGQQGKQRLLIRGVTGHVLEHRAITGGDKQWQGPALRGPAQQPGHQDALVQRLGMQEAGEQ